MGTPDTPASFGAAASHLAKLLSDGARLLIEPAHIRRVAAAKAEEARILTAAEIQREGELAEARYRLEALELFRQRNLRQIEQIAFGDKGPQKQLQNPDWVAQFIESSKDTSDATLQEIWAKLLAGEFEANGSCSKRTLRMVNGLSRAEALMIRQACQRVCCVEEHDGERVLFLNVIVRRIEGENRRILFEDNAPETTRRNRQLIECGFLSNDDYKFQFDGEGDLDARRFALSKFSAKAVTVDSVRLSAASRQPKLLYVVEPAPGPIGFPILGAAVEFDAWRLTPEGAELFHALREAVDPALGAQLRQAMEAGGLSLA